MRRLMLTAGLAFGVSVLAAGGAMACGWENKTASTDGARQTVMAPQTPAPKPHTGG